MDARAPPSVHPLPSYMTAASSGQIHTAALHSVSASQATEETQALFCVIAVNLIAHLLLLANNFWL